MVRWSEEVHLSGICTLVVAVFLDILSLFASSGRLRQGMFVTVDYAAPKHNHKYPVIFPRVRSEE